MQFLRLDEKRDAKHAVRALNRYVQRGKIRPCRIGPANRFAREELLRFVRRQTALHGDTDPGGDEQ